MKLKDYKIKTKIFAGFGMTLALLVLIGGMGIYSLYDVGGLFGEYRQLARQSNATSNVASAMMNTRIAVKNFIIDANDDTVAAVETAAQRTVSVARDSLALTTDPDQKAIVEKVVTGAQNYGATFQQVVGLQDQRNQVVLGQLNVLGPDLRTKLTRISETAYRDGDPDAAFYAGNTQESFMLARLYVQKFLIDNL